jgi:hypothetical protein
MNQMQNYQLDNATNALIIKVFPVKLKDKNPVFGHHLPDDMWLNYHSLKWLIYK